MIRFFLCIGIALFIGTGCRQTPAAVEIVPATSTSLPPTATHVSTDTPQSTVTPQPTGTEPPPTATVTRTPTPKSSATPAPTSIRTDLDAAERIVTDGGFAFRLFLPDLDVELQPTQALFADKKGTFLSSMGGGVEADDSDSLDIILSDILQSLNESMAAGLQPVNLTRSPSVALKDWLWMFPVRCSMGLCSADFWPSAHTKVKFSMPSLSVIPRPVMNVGLKTAAAILKRCSIRCAFSPLRSAAKTH